MVFLFYGVDLPNVLNPIGSEFFSLEKPETKDDGWISLSKKRDAPAINHPPWMPNNGLSISL